MVDTAIETTVSQRLRSCIHELHDRVEETGSARRMVEGRIERAEYVALIEQMLTLHRELEPRLASAGLPSGVFLAEMRRCRALERDLAVLGGSRSRRLHPALERLLRALDSAGRGEPAVWAGVLYVLEGSRMGSMILIGRLAEALGLEIGAGNGLDYHYEGMGEAPRRFKALKELLDGWLVEDLSKDVACFGARLTMAALLEVYAGSAESRELAA